MQDYRGGVMVGSQGGPLDTMQGGTSTFSRPPGMLREELTGGYCCYSCPVCTARCLISVVGCAAGASGQCGAQAARLGPPGEMEMVLL